MTAFFEYPKAAAFGRALPKTKVYAHTKAAAKLRQLFVDQVDQIIWQYKLAPETINLSISNTVSEIQIFRIKLRGTELSEIVLRAIDSAIEFPIIFELSHASQQKVVATCKHRSRSGSIKLLSSRYFETAWEEDNLKRKPLPVSSDLGSLYLNLLQVIVPTVRAENEPLSRWIERAEFIRNKTSEVARLAKKIHNEKQLNKRMDLKNRKLKIEQEIGELEAVRVTGLC